MNNNNCYNCNNRIPGREADYCLHTDLMISKISCCSGHTASVEKPGWAPTQEECAIWYEPQAFAGNPYAFDPLQWA